jgi:hypothetical protein
MGMVPMGCQDLPCKQLFPGRVEKNPVLRDFLQEICGSGRILFSCASPILSKKLIAEMANDKPAFLVITHCYSLLLKTTWHHFDTGTGGSTSGSGL